MGMIRRKFGKMEKAFPNGFKLAANCRQRNRTESRDFENFCMHKVCLERVDARSHYFHMQINLSCITNFVRDRRIKYSFSNQPRRLRRSFFLFSFTPGRKKKLRGNLEQIEFLYRESYRPLPFFMRNLTGFHALVVTSDKLYFIIKAIKRKFSLIHSACNSVFGNFEKP